MFSEHAFVRVMFPLHRQMLGIGKRSILNIVLKSKDTDREHQSTNMSTDGCSSSSQKKGPFL